MATQTCVESVHHNWSIKEGDRKGRDRHPACDYDCVEIEEVAAKRLREVNG